MEIPSCPPTYTCSFDMHPPYPNTDPVPFLVAVVLLVTVVCFSIVAYNWVDKRR